jgi:hypothetical protein
MNSFKISSGPGFGDLRTSESWMEVGLAVAAAAFSLAIWLAADPRSADRFEGAMRVTFPTVTVSAPR